MKRLLIVPLIALAAGCGSAGATSTVTSPPKTVTVKTVDTATSVQLSACQEAIRQLVDTEGKTLDAASAASLQQLTKATGIIENVTHRLKVVKPLVVLCRG